MTIPKDVEAALDFFWREQDDTMDLGERYFHMKVLLERVEELEDERERLLDDLDYSEDRVRELGGGE